MAEIWIVSEQIDYEPSTLYGIYSTKDKAFEAIEDFAREEFPGYMVRENLDEVRIGPKKTPTILQVCPYSMDAPMSASTL